MHSAPSATLPIKRVLVAALGGVVRTSVLTDLCIRANDTEPFIVAELISAYVQYAGAAVMTPSNSVVEGACRVAMFARSTSWTSRTIRTFAAATVPPCAAIDE